MIHNNVTLAPFGGNKSFDSNNRIANFFFNDNGYIDPMSLQLAIEIDLSDLPPYVTSQIDNSAHSLISQLTIKHNGNVIEQIKEYDTLASILADVY